MPQGAEDDLDQLIRRVDPDRWLTSRFIADEGARADVLALYAFDHELARASRVASTQLLAEIRLTWWREALDEIFAGGPVRRHPVAEALGSLARRHGLSREPLEAMIDGQIAEDLRCIAGRPVNLQSGDPFSAGQANRLLKSVRTKTASR